MIIYNYLNKLGVNLDNFKEAFLSHPNYPSMLAITDSLNIMEIENIAANVPFEHFEHLPDMFLVEVFEKQPELRIIKKKGKDIYSVNEKNKKEKISLQSLEKLWRNNLLIVDYKKSKKLNFKKVIAFAIIFLLILSYNIQNIFFVFTSFFGLMISLELIKVNIFNTSDWSESFCEVKKNFSCKEVAKHSNFFHIKNVHFYDFPVIYFIVLSLLLVFEISINFLILLSLFSMPIIIYAVYKQYADVKKWCVLCLAVAFLVAINIMWFVLNYKFTITNDLTKSTAIIMVVIFVWYLFKSYLLKSEEQKNKWLKLERFKKQEDVFKKINIPMMNAMALANTPFMEFGKSSINELILLITPSCPYCHKAVLSAFELLNKFKDSLKLKIGYNLNLQNHENIYINVAKIMMQLYQNKNETQQILLNWHKNLTNYNDFMQQWKELKIDDQTNQVLQMQYEFAASENWNYAPVVILNNKLINSNYEINELFYYFKE